MCVFEISCSYKTTSNDSIHDLFGGETVPDDEHYLNTLDGCKWHTLYCLTSLKSYCQKFLIHEYFIL